MYPNIYETYEEFIERCGDGREAIKNFRETRKLHLKQGFGDYPFYMGIEKHMDKLSSQFADEVEKELEKQYAIVATYIALNGVVMWERLVNRFGIERALTRAYQDVGYYVHENYNERFGDQENISRDLINITAGAYLLERLRTTDLATGKETFTQTTIERINNEIERGGTNAEIAERLRSTNHKPRARSIATTEVGIAQSFIENYTMLRVAQTKVTKKYWIGVLDDRIRDTHLGAATFYNSNNPIPMESYFNVNGSLMLYPRDISAPAEEVVNCRCYLGYSVS